MKLFYPFCIKYFLNIVKELKIILTYQYCDSAANRDLVVRWIRDKLWGSSEPWKSVFSSQGSIIYFYKQLVTRGSGAITVNKAPGRGFFSGTCLFLLSNIMVT